MLRRKQLEREFKRVRELHLSRSEIGDANLRRAILTIASLVLYFATGKTILILVCAAYLFANFIHYSLLKYASRKFSLTLFWSVWLAAFISISLPGGMAVYLALIDGGMYFFIGACLCVGVALYCYSVHSSFTLMAYSDLAVVCLTTIGITYASARTPGSQGIETAIIISGMSVLLFYVRTFLKTIRDRMALQESIDSQVHDQKLKSLGQLTSGVAHDFNNLLTVVGGNIELAMLENLTDDQRILLCEARKSVDRGAGLVSQLLAYSRKSPLHAVKVCSSDVLRRVQEIAQRVVPETIETEIDLGGDHAALKVDSGLLETAILNLLINSRDSLERATGRIRVSSYLLSDQDRFAIVVEDDGPGMDPVTMERATEPFFTTKGPGEGTGLGLSMVKGFAEQSGGDLVLSNRAGGGLVASILLPTLSEQNLSEPA